VTHLWLRAEARETEQRAAITPTDAATLRARGVEVTVEESAHRVWPAEAYPDCTVAQAGSWVDAPDDAVILAIKELPPEPTQLRHRHVMFGHAFKGQDDAAELLQRFADGGGTLLDVEYLVDDAGRRLAAFGYWAGFVGAALSLLQAAGGLNAPLQPSGRDAFNAQLADAHAGGLVALVIGALGRSGRGAIDALELAGAEITGWDKAETRVIDVAAILESELLVNCVLNSGTAPPFLTEPDLDLPNRRLRAICDVTVDVTSAANLLPIYDRVTTWSEPVRRLREAPPLDLIAIDNLPSLVPREASVDFSAELAPQLAQLDHDYPPWRRCVEAFAQACRDHGIDVSRANNAAREPA
jgi:saccharopine dehydrogenase (NAD+, L-lysine-forming)